MGDNCFSEGHDQYVDKVDQPPRKGKIDIDTIELSMREADFLLSIRNSMTFKALKEKAYRVALLVNIWPMDRNYTIEESFNLMHVKLTDMYDLYIEDHSYKIHKRRVVDLVLMVLAFVDKQDLNVISEDIFPSMLTYEKGDLDRVKILEYLLQSHAYLSQTFEDYMLGKMWSAGMVRVIVNAFYLCCLFDVDIVKEIEKLDQ